MGELFVQKAEALTQNLNLVGLLGLVTEICRELDKAQCKELVKGTKAENLTDVPLKKIKK